MSAFLEWVRIGLKILLVVVVVAAVVAVAQGFRGGLAEAFQFVADEDDTVGLGSAILLLVDLMIGWGTLQSAAVVYGGIWSLAAVGRLTLVTIQRA
jgi:hypothetical protein